MYTFFWFPEAGRKYCFMCKQKACLPKQASEMMIERAENRVVLGAFNSNNKWLMGTVLWALMASLTIGTFALFVFLCSRSSWRFKDLGILNCPPEKIKQNELLKAQKVILCCSKKKEVYRTFRYRLRHFSSVFLWLMKSCRWQEHKAVCTLSEIGLVVQRFTSFICVFHFLSPF